MPILVCSFLEHRRRIVKRLLSFGPPTFYDFKYIASINEEIAREEIACN